MDDPKDLAVTTDQTTLFLGARSFSNDGNVPGNLGGSDFWIRKQNIDGTLIWNKNFGGPGNDNLATVMPHTDGGVLAFGTTHTDQGVFGDILGLAGGWLIRTNSNGSLIDGKIFGGNITETAVDASRNPTGTITLALEAASPVLDGQTNNGILDVWIVQVDQSFEIEWSLLIGGSGADTPEAIFTDENGNIYVAATSESNLPDQDPNKGETDVWIIKIAPNGNILWQETLGGLDDDIPTDILYHPDGYVYVMVQSNSADGDFDSNDGLNDLWLVQFDGLSGDLIRKTHMGGSGNDFNGHMDLYLDNQLIISASTTSTNGDITGNKGFGDIWVLRTDLAGNRLSQMNYGGSLNDLNVDIVTIDSVFHVLGSTTSNDKNVPANSLAQLDMWYFSLNMRPDSCSDQWLCLPDTTLNNHLYPPATDALICVDGCTAGYGPGPDFNVGPCSDFNNPTAYFYVTTDTTADLLTLSIVSNEFNEPQLGLLRSVNCNTFQQVVCATGTNGTVVISYIDVQPLTTYVIDLSDAAVNIV